MTKVESIAFSFSPLVILSGRGGYSDLVWTGCAADRTHTCFGGNLDRKGYLRVFVFIVATFGSKNYTILDQYLLKMGPMFRNFCKRATRKSGTSPLIFYMRVPLIPGLCTVRQLFTKCLQIYTKHTKKRGIFGKLNFTFNSEDNICPYLANLG